MTRHLVVAELSKGREFGAVAPEVVNRLHALTFVDVSDRGRGRVWITPRNKVGSVRVGDVQVTVQPKLPVRRLLFLLGYANDPHVREEDVDCDEDQEVIPAVVDALARQLGRAFVNGVPQRYRAVEDLSTAFRGRLRTTAQLSRRLGRPSPLEIEYEEYDSDTLGNRILATAVRKALPVPNVRPPVVSELRRVAALLDRVPSLGPRDTPSSWVAGAKPSAYDAAVRLALVLLADRSIELAVERGEGLPAAAFVVDMWRVFENFVGNALTDDARARSIQTHLGRGRKLDTGRLLEIKPDVLWTSGGVPVAVADVKYTVTSDSGHPNPHVYQVLAYCLALGLTRGYLVYAEGNGTRATYRVGDITVEARALNLDAQPAALRAEVRDLSDAILG